MIVIDIHPSEDVTDKTMTYVRGEEIRSPKTFGKAFKTHCLSMPPAMKIDQRFNSFFVFAKEVSVNHFFLYSQMIVSTVCIYDSVSFFQAACSSRNSLL